MNENDTQTLADCVKVEPSHLNQWQLDFIRARRSYLSREDAKTFAKVIAIRDEEVANPVKE